MNRRQFIKRGGLWVASTAIVPATLADVRLNGSATLKGASRFNQAAVAGVGPTTPPSFLAGSVAHIQDAGVSNINLTATVPAGSNRLMLINIAQGNNAAGAVKAITSVTWNTTDVGIAIPGFSKWDTGFCSVDGYYIVAPTVGTSLTLNVVLASASSLIGIQCVCYTGAAQSSIFGTAVTGSSRANATSTLTVTTGTGQMNWGASCTDANGALTIGGTASPTDRDQIVGISADMTTGIGDCTGSGTFQWTFTPPDNGWAMCAIPVNGL